MGKKGCFSALGTLTLLSCLAGFWPGFWLSSAYAEGSRDLVSSGGDRPFLEFQTGVSAGIVRKTIIKVYANEGETLNLGSSAVGIGSGTINYRRPDGTDGTCNAAGLIANRTQEVAGPGTGANNTFIPCVVTVGAGQSGIWEIDFVSPNQNGTNPTPIAGTGNWTQPPAVGYVSAWDVTVKSSSGTAIPGRVYANYFALNMGANGRSISSLLRVLTQEGYQYGIDLNGLDPFGFIFFANRNGFTNQVTGNPIFRSLQLAGANPGNLPTGYTFQNPNLPDSGNQVTHKTFINVPDPGMPAIAPSPTGPTWLYRLPSPPPVPTNFKFTGSEGTLGQAGTSPLGGNLSFDSTSDSSYSITLDLNQDGIYGNGNDRTFLGTAQVGSNTVFWDGKDSAGVSVAVNAAPYNVKVNMYAGEVHFPMIDAEQNPNGIIVQRLNQPPGPTSPLDNPFNVYYDDRNTGADYSVCATGETNTSAGVATPVCYGGGPTPRQALLGVNSSTGAHRFTSNFGDRRGIDTWAYYPSLDANLNGGIVLRQADIVVGKTVSLATANAGDALTYTITVANNGPSDAAGVTFQDSVPAALQTVVWSCSITSGTGSCGSANGTGNSINTTLNLNNQAVATYTVTGTLASSTPTSNVTNSATATRAPDITDPNLTNNTDSVVTAVTAQATFANVLLIKRITAINRGRSNPRLFDTSFVDVGTSNDGDNAINWPGPPRAATIGSGTVEGYLAGIADGAANNTTIGPSEQLEYTISFLSAGTSAAQNLMICDRIPTNTTFIGDAFNSSLPAGAGFGDRGILLNFRGSEVALTNANDGDELINTSGNDDGVGGYYFPAGVEPSTTFPNVICGGTNTNGAIVVDLSDISFATGEGTPANSYGFIRFRAGIN